MTHLRECPLMVVALVFLTLYGLAGKSDLESAEITAKHMPPADPCQVTVRVYEAGERWTMLRKHQHCAAWAKKESPWMMSMPIIQERK